MSTALQNAFPALWRLRAYIAYALVGIGLGSTQVGYAAADAGQPTWLVVALAVYAYLGTAFGVTAAANVRRS